MRFYILSMIMAFIVGYANGSEVSFEAQEAQRLHCESQGMDQIISKVAMYCETRNQVLIDAKARCLDLNSDNDGYLNCIDDAEEELGK